MRIGLSESAGRYQNTKTARILLLIAALCLMLSLNVDGYYPILHTPAEVVKSIVTWFQLTFAEVFHTPMALRYYEITGEMPYYGGVIERIRLMAMTFLCGALMALSGSIFQTVFRNPMAAPTMLGVSAGVNAGVLVLVLQYEFAATTMLFYKYVYCYIGAVIMLTLVLVMRKISSGKGRRSGTDPAPSSEGRRQCQIHQGSNQTQSFRRSRRGRRR